jgi:hypothetical protein
MNIGVDSSGELPTSRGPSREEDASPDRFSLLVVEGPDAGRSYTMDVTSPVRVLVGKSAMCTLRLSDHEVSRRHASFRIEGHAIVVADLGSTNGTFVNGVAVREAALTGGEAIRIGRSVISVVRGAPSAVTLTNDTAFGRLMGGSTVMRRLYPVLHSLAAADRPILLEGESGVGKELCAEELHAHSSRAANRFLKLTCHALGPDEIDERLFAPGGLLEGACDGTLFIDELAALPLPTQRILARRAHERGPGRPRFVFATTRDLDRDAGEGRVADELLAVLASARIELPPLRHRAGDIELLARTFWAAHTSDPLPADFVPRFADYPWPGNVRELMRAVAVRFEQGVLGRWRVTMCAT